MKFVEGARQGRQCRRALANYLDLETTCSRVDMSYNNIAVVLPWGCVVGCCAVCFRMVVQREILNIRLCTPFAVFSDGS